MSNEIAEDEKLRRRVDLVRHDLEECRKKLEDALSNARHVLADIGHILHMMKRKEK